MAPSLGGLLQPGDQAAVLGDVVGGPADGLLGFGEHRSAVGRPDHRTVARRPRIAAGPAVGLDDHLHCSDPVDPQQDCAALRAAQHLVVGGGGDPGQLAAVDLDPARTAAAALQPRRTAPPRAR